MGVQCRTTKKGELQVGTSDIRVLPISDSVAEGVVMCLEELLKKCHLGSVDQVGCTNVVHILYYPNIRTSQFSSANSSDIVFE